MRMRQGLALQVLVLLGLRIRSKSLSGAGSHQKAIVPTLAALALFSGKDLFKKLVLVFGPILPLSQALSDPPSADWPAVAAMFLGSLRGHYKASLVILIMLTGGEYLEEVAMGKASDALDVLLTKTPGVAERWPNRSEISVEVVKPNDLLLVKSLEIVPVDGVVVETAANDVLLNEQLITGETSWVKKTLSSEVYGGSVNMSSEVFVMKASKTYENSLVFLLKTQLARALEKRSDLELSAKKIAKLLNPLTVVGVAAALLLHNGDLDVALSVLMSATPCPASIGVPVAMLSGMSNATRKLGVSIKSGGALERLAKVDCVVFDKTGTLTTGALRANSANENVPWDLLASVESLSTHPLARAICDKLEGSKLLKVDDFFSCEKGVRGKVGEFSVKIGVREFADVLGVESFVDSSSTATTAECYWSVESKADRRFGRILFEDDLRPNAIEVVTKLRSMGIKVVLLTGDRRPKEVEKFASLLKIDEHAICWPHEKADYVSKLNSNVLMIGDGDNDAAALATASVGMSLNASNVSSSAADLVLTRVDLKLIVELMTLAKRTLKIAETTVKLGTAASLMQMLLAITGKTSPLTNAVAQECVDLFSILYSLRAL